MIAMISIIVALANESHRAAQCCHQIDMLNGKLGHDYEVIMVDGMSTDDTRSHLTHRYITHPRGRGGQMHAGAAHARGDILWFIHADSQLHPQSLHAIQQSRADFGCFTLQFAPTNWALNLLAWGSNHRVDLRNIPFGDQGMFCSRTCYETLGGFKSLALMEDYDLSLRARAQGYHAYRIDLPIITSSRRFLRNSKPHLPTIIRRIIIMQRAQHAFRAGSCIDDIMRLYESTSH